MNLTQLFLDELDREAARTRRALENVPTGRDDWKPHPKSMPLARLAGLVASMPSWVTLIIEQDELDLTPPPGRGQYQPPATDQLVETLDKHVAKARESLSNTNDGFLLTTNWRLRAGGQIVMDAASRPVVGSSRIRIGVSRTIARAIAIRRRCPPDSVDPRSPTIVAYPYGRFRMNSCALASCAARIVSSGAAVGLPYAMFSQMVPRKSSESWRTKLI